jgi:hypothetical protein
MTTGTPTPPLPKWKRILFSLVLFVFACGILEFAARWYLAAFEGFDGKHLMQYEFDPYKNNRPTPNYVDTRGVHHNSQGFRRLTDVSREKPPNTYRIFLMGGSTGYGLGGLWPHLQRDYAVLRDSQIISAYLERYLADSFSGMRIEVINAAITSDWTHHHLIYLNQAILNYDPDMVLFLDGFNDFYFFERGHDQFASYAYQERSRVIMGDPTLASLVFMNGWWLFRKSAFANVTMRALQNVKLLLQGRPDPNRTPIDADEAMAGLRQNFPRNALTMQRRIGLILRDARVSTVFMLQPMLILERDHKPMPAMERKLFDFNVVSYLPNYEAFMHQAVPYVHGQEEAMAQQVGAHFIDLTPIYAGVPEQVYTDYCHLTPLANSLLARDVVSKIVPWIKADMARKNTTPARPHREGPTAAQR